LLEARRYRPVGSRPLFLLGEYFFGGLMGSSSVEDRVQAIAERVALDHGLELVHAEVAGPENKPIVRIFIDKPNGVTHKDCSEVSLHVGTFSTSKISFMLPTRWKYRRPGSSEGLYKRPDYERFAGSSGADSNAATQSMVSVIFVADC
jgi:ribosome maturation factor RimP